MKKAGLNEKKSKINLSFVPEKGWVFFPDAVPQ